MGGGKIWTLGLAWGMLAWIPFFANLPGFFEVTLGLPVLLAGFCTVFLEQIVGTLPNSLGFVLSLPVGMLLSWFLYTAYQLTQDTWWSSSSQQKKAKKLGRGVE